ncbi:MAG: hypothetical protein H0T76_05450 [Nannocystis sp.]|nr:hypothetical protein [Nannocystis sp.]MBA3545910.1 hypothetical protein [Nannocystis sp.]
MPIPKLGVLLNDEKALHAAREADPVAFVVLRSTLINPPRAAGARGLAQRLASLHPGASVVPYVWHLVTHGAEDGVREFGTRSLPGEARRFGHLQDTAEVREAWQTTLRCAQEFGSTRVLLRTPPSFTPGAGNQARLAAFVAARAAEGLEVVWEADGLWESKQTLALARKLGMQTVVPAFDGAGRPFTGELERRWLRVDGAGPTSKLRGVLGEALAHAIETAETPASVVLFAGPRAYGNLRAFAEELSINAAEAGEADDDDDDDDDDDGDDDDDVDTSAKS